jgi:hypothetical protein
MPAVVDNVRDVRGAADNVSLISNVGIWQFLLIVLVIASVSISLASVSISLASVSISFVFDFDISAVPARQSPISVDWRNESSWRLESEQLQGEAKPQITRCECISTASGGGTARATGSD